MPAIKGINEGVSLRIAEEQETAARNRESALAMNAPEFRLWAIDSSTGIVQYLESLPERKVASGKTPKEARHALRADRPIPGKGEDIGTILERAADLLLELVCPALFVSVEKR